MEIPHLNPWGNGNQYNPMELNASGQANNGKFSKMDFFAILHGGEFSCVSATTTSLSKRLE